MKDGSYQPFSKCEVVGERVDFDLQDIGGIAGLVGGLGSVDTLVNNAGVLYCEPLDSIPEAHRVEILKVNLVAFRYLNHQNQELRTKQVLALVSEVARDS